MNETSISGPISKMKVHLEEEVQYQLHLGDEVIEMNPLVGQHIQMVWTKQILCSVCGNPTNKSFAGSCYTCFSTAPENSECIINPELCLAHLGQGLRDADWDDKHHNKPHFVYLALTDTVKVGVTRHDQVPTRWIDQGAWKAIRLAEVPYRQLAGEIEVALKEYMTDKTNWRNMLRDIRNEEVDLEEAKYEIVDYLDESLQDFVTEDDEVMELKYPVIKYPEKVNSINFDKVPEINGRLAGIRGQYLIFSDGRVINLRRHSGYVIEFSSGVDTATPTLFD